MAHVKRKAIDIYRDLIRSVGCVYHTHNDGLALQRHLKAGTEPPEHLLPGRMLKYLSEEDREELKKLTSEEVMKERIL